MFIFSLLKPITSISEQSTVILFITSAIIIGIWFIKNITKVNRYTKVLFLVCIVIFWISIDSLARYNGMQAEILYKFTIYGIIPLLLLGSVSDFNYVLKYFCKISIITGLLYVIDPFMNYRWSGTYMTFGFSVILPAFCGALLYYKYYQKKSALFVAVLFFVEMIMFANKSAILCGVVFLLVYYIYFNNSKVIKWRRTVLTLIIIIMVIVFRNTLLDTAIDFVEMIGVDSYSLRTIQIMLSSESDLVFGARISIWQQVIEVIRSNFIFGRGIGYLESDYSNISYAHNVFLDILASGGICVGIFYLYFLVSSLFKVIKLKDKNRKIFAITIFLLWFVPMQFSLSLWEVINFWIYWGLCYCCSEKRTDTECIIQKMVERRV